MVTVNLRQVLVFTFYMFRILFILAWTFLLAFFVMWYWGNAWGVLGALIIILGYVDYIITAGRLWISS